MKERLAHFISAHGLKHWSFAARKDPEFMEWLRTETPDMADDTPFAERVWSAVSGTRPTCDRGGVRKLNSIEKGWRFCGRAATCECARESVSKSMAEAHAAKPADERKQIAAKGAATMLSRHGVTNAGQLDHSRERHKEFYADQTKREQAVAKGRATMLERHGVSNALQLPAVDEYRRNLASTLSAETKAAAAAKRVAHAKDGGLLKHSYAKVSEKFLQNNIRLLTPFKDYVGVSNQVYYDFACTRCNLEFTDYVDNGNVPTCPVCDAIAPRFQSRQEDAVADFIANDLGIEILRNSKKLIKKELDIYSPSLKIAVEYCGLYWHSEAGGGKGKSYHLDKLSACIAHGTRLITIFADEWTEKPEIVKERLRHIFGRSGQSVHARKCNLVELDMATANAFIGKHHIQGTAAGASFAVGLEYGGALVSVMTFGPLRRVVNSRAKDDKWELYRFASSQRVVGGASKMFTHFVREFAPTEVVSYCDRRWGDGRVYSAMGFEKVGESAPGYWWMHKYMSRQHRFNFTKHRLVEQGHDPSMTEVEIMRSIGYDRIWDCGNLKFVWKPE